MWSSCSKLSEKPKIVIVILEPQQFLSYWSKCTNYCFDQWLKTAWPIKNLMPYLRFFGQLASRCLHNFVKNVNDFEMVHKSAKFWFGVPSPPNKSIASLICLVISAASACAITHHAQSFFYLIWPSDSDQLMEIQFVTLSQNFSMTVATESPSVRPPVRPQPPTALPNGGVTNGPNGDNNGTAYCFVFTGCELQEMDLKEWLRACAKQVGYNKQVNKNWTE